MAKINLDKMSLEDLKALEKDVAKAIASFEKRRIADARKAVEALAKEHGVSLDQLVGKGRKPKKAKAAAKYKNPKNPDETWSGRGRQPEWFKKATKGGASKESLAI